MTDDTIVTRTEFIADWTTRFDLGNRGEASRLFDRADVTKDGHIGRDDLPEIFAYFDMNGNEIGLFKYGAHSYPSTKTSVSKCPASRILSDFC